MTVMVPYPITAQEWRERAGRRNGPRAAPAPQPVKTPETPADAERWEAIIDEIAAFQHLGENWDGLGAAAPSRELLESAIGLAYTLRLDNGAPPPTRVVVGTAGTVIFEWQEPDGTYCEVENDRPLHADVMLVEPGKAPRHWELPSA